MDKGHGRIERRTYYLTSDLSGLVNAKEWFGLASMGMVCSHIITGETETTEVRYAMTSLKSVDAFANALRKHRGIENGLHDCLDVSFREDSSRIRKDRAPDNMAVVRHFVLSALKQIQKTKRASMKRKRKICVYDLDLLSDVVD